MLIKAGKYKAVSNYAEEVITWKLLFCSRKVGDALFSIEASEKTEENRKSGSLYQLSSTLTTE